MDADPNYLSNITKQGTENSNSGNKPVISVTTDINVAKRFMGPNGVLFQATINRRSLIPSSVKGGTEIFVGFVANGGRNAIQVYVPNATKFSYGATQTFK